MSRQMLHSSCCCAAVVENKKKKEYHNHNMTLKKNICGSFVVIVLVMDLNYMDYTI